MYLKVFIAIGVFLLIGLSCYNFLDYPRISQYFSFNLNFNSSFIIHGEERQLYVSLCHEKLTGPHRTGNQLFMLAAMLHVAQLTGRTVIMPKMQWSLDEIFDIDVARVKTDDVEKELCPCERFVVPDYAYDPRLRNATFLRIISRLKNLRTILLCGLAQSTSYAVGVEAELRQLLKFKRSIYQFALEFIEQHRKLRNESSFGSLDPLRIGVHIRRGDFMKSYQFGLTVVDRAYLEHSFDYFAKGRSNVQFVIATEDWQWADENLPSNKLPGSNETRFEIVRSANRTTGEDLAILSMCDAVIMSTGSFGWWAAWLANKTTVYYKNWPRSGSVFEMMTIPEEKFPKTWIPML